MLQLCSTRRMTSFAKMMETLIIGKYRKVIFTVFLWFKVLTVISWFGTSDVDPSTSKGKNFPCFMTKFRYNSMRRNS